MRIKGKVAVVTGGSSRLGKEISLMLARAGAQVMATYYTSVMEAESLVNQAEYEGIDIQTIRCSVMSQPSVETLAHRMNVDYGRVDIIINGASCFLTTPTPLDDMMAWRHVTGTAIDGTFFVFNTLSFLMSKGVVINLLDNSIREPWSNFTAHAVGKSAMEAMTRQWALECAPKIRSNAVCLGPVLPPEKMSADSQFVYAQRTLLKRWGSVDDAIMAVKYLVEADYVTGEILTVDGGERYA
ncbi:MAG: SDR family NAD(P)-dependent oxidoreductase [Planctomycetota bacterium]|jgi:NAD(P)-dependent dehydrogenase (short-subunit alcohol dehydrogenase family)